MNVNRHMKGSTVEVIAAGPGHMPKALLPSFPGWGEDLEVCKLHMRRVELGERGVITTVESHGMNPWTRYTILLDDGSRVSGVNPVSVVVV